MLDGDSPHLTIGHPTPHRGRPQGIAPTRYAQISRLYVYCTSDETVYRVGATLAVALGEDGRPSFLVKPCSESLFRDEFGFGLSDDPILRAFNRHGLRLRLLPFCYRCFLADIDKR